MEALVSGDVGGYSFMTTSCAVGSGHAMPMSYTSTPGFAHATSMTTDDLDITHQHNQPMDAVRTGEKGNHINKRQRVRSPALEVEQNVDLDKKAVLDEFFEYLQLELFDIKPILQMEDYGREQIYLGWIREHVPSAQALPLEMLFMIGKYLNKNPRLSVSATVEGTSTSNFLLTKMQQLPIHLTDAKILPADTRWAYHSPSFRDSSDHLARAISVTFRFPSITDPALERHVLRRLKFRGDSTKPHTLPQQGEIWYFDDALCKDEHSASYKPPHDWHHAWRMSRRFWPSLSLLGAQWHQVSSPAVRPAGWWRLVFYQAENCECIVQEVEMECAIYRGLQAD